MKNILTVSIKVGYNTFVSCASDRHAGLAQLVEQLIRNEQVTGSSPATSSIGKSRPPEFRGFFLCLDMRGDSRDMKNAPKLQAWQIGGVF